MENTYRYDRRGNLSLIMENGQTIQQYVYGALNRLEEAVDQAGKAAKYQYNGLGHRVGRQEGNIPKEQLEHLDPRNRIKGETEIGNWSRIRYTIDLTREYHNLLERSEGDSTQTYFWDGNVTSYEENGRQSYYLQDELGSPLRIEDELGATKESYGYGAFGEDLYGNQGEIQPFGYTGYQMDVVAGTYYAQAREYQAESGRFNSQDIIGGFIEEPITINRYGYCWGNPVKYVDIDGKLPTILVGALFGGVVSGLSSVATQLIFDGKINWKEVFSNTIGGAVQGGIAGSGIGIVGGIIAMGATGTATNVATQVYAQDKKLTEVDWGSAVVDGVIDAATYGYGRYKLKGKGLSVQEQLRKTNDDVHAARLHVAGYGKKRMKGKSYKRAIGRLDSLEKLQDMLGKEWLTEQGMDSVKKIVESIGREKIQRLLGPLTVSGMNEIEQCVE